MKSKINNIIVFSDPHCGCRFGLCPDQVMLDGGGSYISSKFQKEVYKKWLEFWHEWVPLVTKKEPYIVVCNGDMIDGVHHNATTQISHNLQDQKNIAVQIMKPILSLPHCERFYMIRGTEVHTGHTGCDEEAIAKELNAVKTKEGEYSRYELWIRFGENNLCHFTHHVGTTNSAAYESTAIYKELVEAYNECGRWNERPPNCIIRSHRHRSFKIEVPSDSGQSIAICTPGWQLKTPHVYKGSLGRAGTPHVGGFLIRSGDEDTLYTRSRIWKMERTKPEII